MHLTPIRKLALTALLSATAILAPSPGAVAADLEKFSFYAGTAEPVDHGQWAAFLAAYVSTREDGINVVDYGGVSEADRQSLKSYIAQLEATDPTTLDGDEAFAYWVNLYNAVTIDVVLDHYPVGSIRDIRTGLRAGPWKRELVTVNGEALTLDNIEHDILRVFWKDERVHYAVNCASIGCPNLATKPYSGTQLDPMLDAAAKAYINHPRGARFEADGDLVVSKIYRWFDEDFGNSEMGVITHLRRYADDELRDRLSNTTSIRSYEYDWSLNDVAK